MAKIETVTLKNLEIIETEAGEFEKKYTNEKKFPASITNYSLSMGEKMGLIKSSQLEDLTDIQQLFHAAIDPNTDQDTALQGLDMSKYLKVIYLAVIGVNKGLNLTYEDFLDLYHEDKFTTIDTYTNLVLATFKEGANKFVQGLEKSTKKK